MFGIDKDAVEKKDPSSNLLEKSQGQQRGLVLQIDESMLLLGQLQDTVKEQAKEEASRQMQEYSNKQFDAVLNEASTSASTPAALLMKMESDVQKAVPEGAAPLRRRRHTRNNSRSAPSLLSGDLFKMVGGDDGGGGDDDHGIYDPNDLLADTMESESFEYCALNHIVSA
jgi:hypothetical protein